MSTIPYDKPVQDWEEPDQESCVTPGRLRRHFFKRKSAALAAVITCAAGFYAGIRVEKGQLASTASAATTTAPAAGAAGAGAGTARGFAGRFGGGAGGNASIGTVSSVSGNTIYLTTTTGNTVKVTLSSSTKVTKSLGVSKSSLHPGDAVVVQGVKNSSGTVVATSVSDTGARGTGTGGGGRAAAGGSNTSGTAGTG